MMWVCPVCCEIFSIKTTQCPVCGADLPLDERTFTEKLVRALDHPEPRTAMRAAATLARRDEPEHAGTILVGAFRTRSHEPCVAAAITRALGQFTTTAAHDALIEALGHESFIVRAAAAESLRSQVRVGS